MTRASEYVFQINDITDILISAEHLGDTLYLAAGDSTFSVGARYATQAMVDAINAKISTARELLDEMKGRLS